jgi:hypothetical protein
MWTKMSLLLLLFVGYQHMTDRYKVEGVSVKRVIFLSFTYVLWLGLPLTKDIYIAVKLCPIA